MFSSFKENAFLSSIILLKVDSSHSVAAFRAFKPSRCFIFVGFIFGLIFNVFYDYSLTWGKFWWFKQQVVVFFVYGFFNNSYSASACSDCYDFVIFAWFDFDSTHRDRWFWKFLFFAPLLGYCFCYIIERVCVSGLYVSLGL